MTSGPFALSSRSKRNHKAGGPKPACAYAIAVPVTVQPPAVAVAMIMMIVVITLVVSVTMAMPMRHDHPYGYDHDRHDHDHHDHDRRPLTAETSAIRCLTLGGGKSLQRGLPFAARIKPGLAASTVMDCRADTWWL